MLPLCREMDPADDGILLVPEGLIDFVAKSR